MGNSNNTIRARSIQDLSNYINILNEESEPEKSAFLFRGQPKLDLKSCECSLLPKLFRNNIIRDIELVEHEMFEEFKRVSLPQLEFLPESELDYLAVAQHHNMSTRLLDWTYSALAALWFAIDSSQGKDSCVWVLKTKKEDFYKLDSSQPLFKKKRNEELITISLGSTKIIRSRMVAKRISAQQGAFTIHQLHSNKGDFRPVPLERNANFKRRLLRIDIPASISSDLLNQLNVAGVNQSTLFPDLDGLCQYLDWRYIHRKKSD